MPSLELLRIVKAKTAQNIFMNDFKNVKKKGLPFARPQSMKCFSMAHQNILRISALKVYIYITVQATKDVSGGTSRQSVTEHSSG